MTEQNYVIAGPYGHWYAQHNGELVCLPMTTQGDQPPHPAVDPNLDRVDGWYSPDDMTVAERWGLTHRLQAVY